METTSSATAAAAAKIAKPKKAGKVSPAKPQEQTALPLPGAIAPEFGQIDPNAIVVLDQVRTEFDEASINELAEDIAARGILQPLTVRYREGQYVLVAGERRLRAAKLAQLASVPVMISTMNDQEHHQAQLAENIQREDLSLQELAKAIAALYAELGTVGAVANRVKKSKAWVSKRLALANGLGTYASDLLRDGITEDLELLQAVNKLDQETPGTNQAWALCQRIRAGKAGRTEAREAVAAVIKARTQAIESRQAVTTPKTPEQLEKETQRKIHEQEMSLSNAFRYWLQHSHPWMTRDYIEAMTKLCDSTEGADILHKLQIVEEMQRNLAARQTALLDSIRTRCSAIAKSTGDLVQHTAYLEHLKTKDSK